MKSRARRQRSKIIFITGTDTGVGKTVFTGLLLHHLRTSGVHALAMKPFCSGGRGDVRLLRALLDGELSEEEMNPYYFPEPVAPLVSVRQRKRLISLGEVVRSIKKMATRCECLLIEGSGGLLVPLGEKYFVSDLIRRLDCAVIVVARNQLGTINHTLLTVSALRGFCRKTIVIALMGTSKKDASVKKNGEVLRGLLKGIEVHELDFLSKNASKSGVLKKSHRKVKKTLAKMYR
jgi:dethiobiotin synthetase